MNPVANDASYPEVGFYGCTLCDTVHWEGQSLFVPHLYYRSSRGTRQEPWVRLPLTVRLHQHRKSIMTPNTVFLIWNKAAKAWWRPAGRGYTSKLNEAGVYTEAQCKGWIHRDEDEPKALATVLRELRCERDSVADLLRWAIPHPDQPLDATR